ncbi:MAG: hypothetical protein QMD71_02395 [bacterium]|nr:hypothetical protein [bacterium]
MEILKINKNGMLVLPKSLIPIFKPSDEIACFANGDTLILKKVTPPYFQKYPKG